MSSLREQRPLLREDISDEEFQQEFRPPRHMGCRGKARNTVKGAAAIIKQWPGYWSSSLTYSWIGIGMFALMTFVLYSTVLTYTLIPTTDSIPIPQYVNERKNTLPEVFMHVIVNNEKEIDLDKYLPYVEIIANKYLHYQFNLMFMINDTLKLEQATHQARINNEDAMNSLWAEHDILELKKVPTKIKSNIIIQHVSVSNYLDSSPIRQYWKQLPNQLIGFLVRAVSIWDKGGIAFSPIILTPRSPDAIYIEKLYSLLLSYEERKKLNITSNIHTLNDKKNDIEVRKVLNNHKRKYKKKVNNIRDIIDALESENLGHQNQPEVLTEAENRHVTTELEMKPSKTEIVFIRNNHSLNRASKSEMDYNHTISDYSLKNNQSTALNSILPSFLNFLFNDKSNITVQEQSTYHNFVKRSTTTVSTDSTQENLNKATVIQPMIISAPSRFEKKKSSAVEVMKDSSISSAVENLTIDLKGNILATKSSCHAFLGSVFSNIKHGTDEDSLKEFIIRELSLFCNGLLSTCKGVDVILL